MAHLGWCAHLGASASAPGQAGEGGARAEALEQRARPIRLAGLRAAAALLRRRLLLLLALEVALPLARQPVVGFAHRHRLQLALVHAASSPIINLTSLTRIHSHLHTCAGSQQPHHTPWHAHTACTRLDGCMRHALLGCQRGHMMVRMRTDEGIGAHERRPSALVEEQQQRVR
jgi:hypothetical protein